MVNTEGSIPSIPTTLISIDMSQINFNHDYIFIGYNPQYVDGNVVCELITRSGQLDELLNSEIKTANQEQIDELNNAMDEFGVPQDDPEVVNDYNILTNKHLDIDGPAVAAYYDYFLGFYTYVFDFQPIVDQIGELAFDADKVGNVDHPDYNPEDAHFLTRFILDTLNQPLLPEPHFYLV